LHSRYSDFVRAERQRVADEAYRTSVGWWREHLLGLRRLALPYAGAAAPRAPDAVPVTLSRALGQAIRDFARREGCTSFEILLAAWACALHRYTAQTDFAVGTMVAHDRRDHGGVLGFFVNTVVLRCDLSGRPTFLELVRRMGETVRMALRHREVDFGDVVRAHREAGPGQRIDQSALVQATLNLVPAFPPLGGDHGAGWAWDNELAMPVRPAKFELALELVEAATGLHGKLEYATDLFDRDTAVALASHFVVLLEGALAAPDAQIGTLPLLTAKERQRLLLEWNTTAETLSDACLHQRFEVQAESTPDAVAVIFEGEELSYGELDARANRLAHHLRSLGVGPEARVAVCLRRSAQTIVALLGVLKAGGAYVPLDPAHPRERIAFMLEDAAPVALITETALASRLPDAAGHRVWVDADADAIAACSSSRVRHDSAQPDGSAYVIYTSGSTGRPKAVVGLHRGAMNFLRWLWRTLPFETGEVCAQKTSLSFVDAFVEIFGPLLRGVPLVVVPDEDVKDPARLIELLAVHRVTRLILVPSLLRVMLDVHADAAARLGRLKYWLLSGERLPDALLERLHGELPDAIVLNTYGSSEVSANATSYTCRPGAPASIGRPVDNTRVYVLDSDLQPVPVGIPGELYVGGVGLARGYLSQPARTAERFVPDPFSQRGGERLYRMGDRVRWLPDGNLEFLGRVDHQVKVRGYRIELGEIEFAISSHPAVRDCVVLVREDEPGDSRLIAYVAFREQPGPSDTALRDHVSTQLPVYMVPSAFVAVSALPLTASGKVDRRALAAQRAPRPIPPAECVPLQGDVEEALAEIWKDVLNVAVVDGRRPFFEQGGNSLLLVRVHQRIRSELRVEIPVGELFGHPTIEALAKRIRNPPPTAPPPRTSSSPGPAARSPEIETAASMSTEALKRLIDEKYSGTSADVSHER
jgi:amino acid adenylation domain-containing protein